MMSAWGHDATTGVGASLGPCASTTEDPLQWGEEEVDEDIGLSSHKVAEALAAVTSLEGHRPTERLGRELLERRRGFDQKLAAKTRREAEVEEARQRLEEVQDRRRSAAAELSARQADVEQLVTRLSFTRRRIEETEREVALLREARAQFGQEEVARLMHRFGDLTKPSESAGREAAKKELHYASKDTQGGPELREKVERMLRRRADLQARQQLLVAGQLQTERERIYARREVEAIREELSHIREGRLRASEDKLSALEKATDISKSLGVGPAVLDELLAQHQPSGGRGAMGLSRPGPPRAAAAAGVRQRPARSSVSAAFAPPASPPPKDAEAGGGDVASWWRGMLQTSSGAGTGTSAASSAQVRERAQVRHPPPQEWAQFGSPLPQNSPGLDSEGTSQVAVSRSGAVPPLPPTGTLASAFRSAPAPPRSAAGLRPGPVEPPGAFCAT